MSRLPPLDIELTNFESPPLPTYSHYLSNSELYIPVHRRKPSSETSPRSSAASSPSSSSTSIVVSDILVYKVDDLILLSRSPLARLSDDERTHLRESAPEIVTSRRQRTSLAWHTNRLKAEKRMSGVWTTGESRADQTDSWRKDRV